MKQSKLFPITLPVMKRGSYFAGGGTILNVSNPSFTAQNTTVTNNLGPDGFTWAQANPITVDKYGKFITLEQSDSNGLYFIYSNNAGQTWTDGLNQPFITRGMVAYDSTNDILHVLFRAVNSTDGIIYRRFTISRDGSNNITGITRDTNVNLQLDYDLGAGLEYEHPVLLWLNDAGFGTYGALVAFWGVSQGSGGTTGSEVRTSMRVLTNTVADNTAANWKAPVADSATTISNDAQVPFSLVEYSNNGVVPYPSANRKQGGTHAKDIYIVYAIANFGVYFYKTKRMRWNSGTNDWSTGFTTAVELGQVKRAGTDSGYSLKQQLLTSPREDSVNDRMVFGVATWKNDTDGDSWGFVTIGSDDSLSAIVDVYTAGSANNGGTIFITGDILCDSGYVVVTYTDLPRKDAYATVYDSSGSRVQVPLLIFNSSPVDIPTLYQDFVTTRIDGKFLVAFRNFNVEARNNPPTYTGSGYDGYVGTLLPILVN